jgi:hypothetical protein
MAKSTLASKFVEPKPLRRSRAFDRRAWRSLMAACYKISYRLCCDRARRALIVEQAAKNQRRKPSRVALSRSARGYFFSLSRIVSLAVGFFDVRCGDVFSTIDKRLLRAKSGSWREAQIAAVFA